MKTIKQLLRQTLKTAAGLILMTLAAAILCLCVGQALAAQQTEKALDERFSTVAIPLVEENVDGEATASGATINEETMAWLEKIAVEHPDIVKSVSRHGILSAYIPELTPLNIVSEQYVPQEAALDKGEYRDFQASPQTMPYSCAMLVVTLDEVKVTPQTSSFRVENLTMDDFASESDYFQWVVTQAETISKEAGYKIDLTGTVTDVVSLADGYRDPVGMTARLTMEVPNIEAFESLQLGTGQQYIIYGMDYVDEYWQVVGELNYDGRFNHIQLEPYNPDWMDVLNETRKEFYSELADRYPGEREYLRYIAAFYHYVYLTEEEYLKFNAISMTLNHPEGGYREYEAIRDEYGLLQDVVEKTDVTYVDADGQTVTLSREEYYQNYAIPSIAKLEGSVEDFLASDAGAQWKAALERDAINNHSFALIGVDKLGYLADFALEKTQIVEGRDFTAEELASGAPVCIIYEALAQANGLSVGDTISAQLYRGDTALPYQDSGELNPSASFYFSTTPFEETAEYTIIGICRSPSVFANVSEDEYAYTANTIFVPKSAVQTPMETRNSVLFNTLVLHNGKLDEFHDLALSSGFGGRFKYYDQGYSTIASNFHNYQKLARQILIIGAVIYAVLLLLFLLLYPGTQKKNVRTMHSFGAPFGRRFGSVLAFSMAIVVPASVLGGLTGMLLWDKVVAALQATAESAVALQIAPGVLVSVAAVQLALALILNVLVAIFVAAPRGMSARR